MAKEIIRSLPSNEFIRNLLGENYDSDFGKIRLYKSGAGNTYLIESGDNPLMFKMTSSLHHDDSLHGRAFSILQSLGIISYLHENGFPVVEIEGTNKGSNNIEFELPEGKAIGYLFKPVFGKDITYAQLHDIASNTARMHSIMDSYPKILQELDKSFYIDRWLSIAAEYVPAGSRIDFLTDFGNHIWNKTRNLPMGFCHGDYGFHNMTCTERRIYVFDFDVSSMSFPMYDIALACNATDFFNLRRDDIAKTKENLDIFASSYSKYRILTEKEAKSLLLMLAIRKYEVTATVAFIQLHKSGCHWLTEKYIEGMYEWLSILSEYI